MVTRTTDTQVSQLKVFAPTLTELLKEISGESKKREKLLTAYVNLLEEVVCSDFAYQEKIEYDSEGVQKRLYSRAGVLLEELIELDIIPDYANDYFFVTTRWLDEFDRGIPSYQANLMSLGSVEQFVMSPCLTDTFVNPFYAFELTDWRELLATRFLLTTEESSLYECLAWLLSEMTFFGHSYDEHQREINRMKASLLSAECEMKDGQTSAMSLEDLRKDLGLDNLAIETREERVEREQNLQETFDYNRAALEKLKSTLATQYCGYSN
jgi:hypothetical protein